MDQSDSSKDKGVSSASIGDLHLPQAADLHDEEALDVEGEAISRAEAARLGFLDFDLGVPSHPRREAENTDYLPTDPSEHLVDAPRVADKIHAAETFLDAGNLDDALEVAQEAVREHPASPKPRIIMARAFMGLGDYAKALSILLTLPQAEQTAETLYYRGLACAKLNRRDEAVKLLDAAIAQSDSRFTLLPHAKDLVARLKSPPASDRLAFPAFSGLSQGARPTPLDRKKRRRRWGRFATLLVTLPVLLIGALALFLALGRMYPAILDQLPHTLSNLWQLLDQALSQFFR